MPRFKISNGRAAIYDLGHGDAPLTTPMENLPHLYWHNELEHIGIVEVRDYTVNLPETWASSPPRQHTWVLDTHDQPAQPFIYGYVTFGGSRRPFGVQAVIDAQIWPSTTGGIPPHGFMRSVVLGIDGSNIVLTEWARNHFWVTQNRFPAVQIGVRVFITDMPLSELNSASEQTPSRQFRANGSGLSLGRFTTDKQWLRAVETGAEFPLINGVTFGDWPHDWRYRIPDVAGFGFTIACGSAPALTDATAQPVTSQ